MKAIRPFDVVQIVRLGTETRPFGGTEGVARAPAIGDVATIVAEWNPADPEAPVTAEMVDDDGMTIWLADFYRDELALADAGG
jgi:hypothetical protein